MPPDRCSRPPRGHWFLVGLLLLVITLGLLAEGYTHGVLGETRATVARAGASGAPGPAAVTGGGPAIAGTGGSPRSYSMPPRTVALTFDDGPDRTWTPKVLAVLRRYHVPATFFVVGAHAAALPGLVRAGPAAGRSRAAGVARGTGWDVSALSGRADGSQEA